MRMILALVLLVAAGAPRVAHAAACAADGAGFDAQVLAAQTAFRDGELEDFLAQAAAVRTCVPTSTFELSTAQAAQLDRLFGLVAMASQQSVSPWFSAARALEPDSTWPVPLLPVDHPVDRAVKGAAAPGGEAVTLLAPRGSYLQVDGKRSDHASAGWPHVLQRLSADGQVQGTSFVAAGEPLVIPDRGPDGRVIDLPPPPEPSSNLASRVPLFLGALIGGGAGAALYAVGAGVNAHAGEGVDRAEVEERARTGNAFILSGAGVGAAATATAVIAVVTTRW